MSFFLSRDKTHPTLVLIAFQSVTEMFRVSPDPSSSSEGVGHKTRHDFIDIRVYRKGIGNSRLQQEILVDNIIIILIIRGPKEHVYMCFSSCKNFLCKDSTE